jgi:D-xylonolactonase
MGKLTVVVDQGDLCGEGPVWDADTKTLFWTDCVGLRFCSFHQNSGRHEIVKQGLEINGYALNRPGGYVIANSNGIWLWDGANDLRLIAKQAQGAKCQMNDAIADPEGRFFTGSLFYDGQNKYDLGKLIRVDRDATVHVVDDGIHLANGLAFSPDEHILYFTDSAARRIYAYDYDRSTGNIRNRRVLVQVPTEEGLPDGLTVDAAGFLWSAQWYGGCVVRYDPDGRMERRIAVPAKQTSSVAFGGGDLTDIFITSAAKSWPSPLMPNWYDATSGYFGGAVYVTNVGIPGKLDYKANIQLGTRPQTTVESVLRTS